MSMCALTIIVVVFVCTARALELEQLELVSVVGNGIVHSSPFNQAARNWDEEKPIPAKVIEKGTETRIVGGHVRNIEDIPYYVLLSKDEQTQWCGGTIFNKYTIVTAAHCLYTNNRKYDVSSLTVTAGQSNLNVDAGTEVTCKVGQALTHPKYDKAELYYDVAVLHLSEALVFSKFVEPLPIAAWGASHEGILMVAGFGYVKQKRTGDALISVNFAETLKYTHARIIKKSECAQIYQRKSPSVVPIIKHQTLMCAIGEERKGGVTDDACQGDSGGPAVCTDEDGEGYLCGIIATGIGCGLKGYPGIYTNVSVVSDWIQEQAAKEAHKSSASMLEPFIAQLRFFGLTRWSQASQVPRQRTDTSSKHPKLSIVTILFRFCNLFVLMELLFGVCFYNWCKCY